MRKQVGIKEGGAVEGIEEEVTFEVNVGQHNLLRVLRHLVNTELNTKVQARFAVTLHKYTQIQIHCKYKHNYKSTGSI